MSVTRNQLKDALGLGENETLKSVLDETVKSVLDEQFREKFGIAEGKSVDLPKMERQLNNVWRSTPDAVLRDVAPYVVGKGGPSEGSAVLEGSIATWTLFKKSNKGGSPTVFAASCAHCAFPYEIVRPRLPGVCFVEIPRELRGLVVAVGCLPKYFDCRERKYDIAVLKLNRAPAGCDAASLPEFPSRPTQSQGFGSRVGDLTTSGGTVRGHGWVMESDGLITFVEDSAEVGNSGTFMNDVTMGEEDSPVPLGVYCGPKKGAVYFLSVDLKTPFS
ncbi:MAG: hypothetical protein SGARI_005169 [Bacillariaceae sp.]